MLTFEESPQTEPYFDMSKLVRSSPPDSVVSHSSPIMIPSRPAQQDTSFNATANSQSLPAGTIPDSPAPLQKALKNDPNIMVSSPQSSPEFEMSDPRDQLPTPMPGMNLTFEDIHPDIALPFTKALPPAESCFDIRKGPYDDENNVHDGLVGHRRQTLREVRAIRTQLRGLDK